VDIDGDDASLYQGSLIWANGVFEQAISTQDWSGGGGEADAWWSMQPDPTWCDNVCAIELVESVALNAYSTDGFTYTPITGNQVCATYLDSMQDYSDGNWDVFGRPFDNSLTMGLMCNSRTVAAVDFAPLKDITVDIMEITERNGDPVDNFRMGATMDYDVGSDDVAFLAQEGSAAIVSDGGVGDTQWGMMKFPFGCGSNPNMDFDPMINTVTGHGDGMWYDHLYLGDSAWTWLNRPVGEYTQNVVSDREAHFTIAAHDFAGGDTYELAVAQFGLHGTSGGADEAIALGQLTNKWLGFGRGDVNNDGNTDLADIIYLATFVNGAGAAEGPIPFMHLGDVNCDGGVDMADVLYLAEWYFADGVCPCGDFMF
jgi:hypothetical protein